LLPVSSARMRASSAWARRGWLTEWEPIVKPMAWISRSWAAFIRGAGSGPTPASQLEVAPTSPLTAYTVAG
jgi:hypothetical protein